MKVKKSATQSFTPLDWSWTTTTSYEINYKIVYKTA